MLGKHANLPEFAFGEGTDFVAVIQQVAPLDLPWDTSCLSMSPAIVVFKDVPTQTLKMFISKQQRLRLGTKIVVIEIGYCQDTNSTTKTIKAYQQHLVSLQALRQHGFHVSFDKDIHGVPSDYGGTVFNSLSTLLRSIDVSQSAMSQLSCRLSRHAL
jgi:hypothetical protein